MLPSRIYDACREGRTDDIVSWLKTTQKHKPWEDEVCDRWIHLPALTTRDFLEVTEQVFSQYAYSCMYLLGFNNQSRAIREMINQLILYFHKVEGFNFSHLLSRAIEGSAEAGNKQLLLNLKDWYGHLFVRFYVLVGGCRGNHPDIVTHFVSGHYFGAYHRLLFGIGKQGIDLFVQYLENPPCPFICAFVRRDFEQARVLFSQFCNQKQNKLFKECMLSAAKIGDIEMLDHLLQFFHHDNDINRSQVLYDCAIQILLCGHRHALDYMLSILPPCEMHVSNFRYSLIIAYGHADMLVKLIRGKKISMDHKLIATYLNFGGRVTDNFNTNHFRNKKQHLVSLCLSYVMTDKRMVTCVVLNAISFE